METDGKKYRPASWGYSSDNWVREWCDWHNRRVKCLRLMIEMLDQSRNSLQIYFPSLRKIPMALYETDDGTPIMTQSMLKTFKRCPRQTLYKYHDRLKPKVQPTPLKRGSWVHSLLEEHYKGGDWKETHRKLSLQYDQLFDEEKDKLGDLPNDISRLMKSYFWHYRDDQDWEVKDVELTLETTMPDGTLYRCRVDLLVDTPYGLFIVDHKTHRDIPKLTFRLKDPQSALYIWAFRKEGIPVQGFIWNYIKYLPPKPLKFNKNGSLSKRQGETDYPTAYRSIKDQGDDPKDYRDLLLPLQRQRYSHGAPQLSPFFQRATLEKDDGILTRVVREATHTTKRANKYPFEKRDYVGRTVERSCDWCAYNTLCETELFGGNADVVRRQQFKEGDPLDYYQDQKEIGE